MELKFQVHIYHKVATALAPSLRSFLRNTVTAVEYEEVVDTLATMTVPGQGVRVLEEREEEEEGE